MTIKLYGVGLSNYMRMTKALLIEKGLAFEEVAAAPSQKEEFLEISPMGKLPVVQLDDQYLTETLAIATWLEWLQPEPALLPTDPLAAGKAMELVCHVKLDVELVARRLLPEVYFKKPVSESVKASVQRDLDRGMTALSRIFVGAPYAAGPTLTLADFYFYYTFKLACLSVKKVYGTDLLADYPAIQKLMDLLSEHPSIAEEEAQFAA